MSAFLKMFDKWELLKQAVYYFLFILLIWGGSNKFGKKKEFHDDYASMDVMKSLRGLAAIGVILHHISQEQIFQDRKILSPFVNAGAYFVAIFFFCSGFGLIKSLDTKKDYLKGFVKNRIVKAIIVPFYVNVIIYGIAAYIGGAKWPKEKWLLNFSGLTMMNLYAWFPIVLALLYFMFFILFRFVKIRPLCFALMGIFIVGLGMVFCYNGHFAWWSGPKNWWLDWSHPNTIWWKEQKVLWFNGEWWVNSAIAFLIGLIFANYEKQLVGWFQRLYALKFHILLILTIVAFKLSDFGQQHFSYWTEYSGKGPGIEDKIKTYFCQLPLFILLGVLVIVFMMKYHVSNPVTRFFGKFSLDTYLMNLMAIQCFRFLQQDRTSPIKAGRYNPLIYGLAVMAGSVVLGVAEKYLTDGVKFLLFPKKKKVAEKKDASV
ncbi:MAG: acyltransferase [Clostridiales bacterium]|nr:acyltransferase [Clostridiales bacterium]